MNRGALSLTLSLFLTLGSVGDVVTQPRPPQLSDFGGGGLRSPIVINSLTGQAFIYVNGAIRSLSPPVSVLNFQGVLGDGVSDDGPGIQVASDYCAANGYELVFPAPAVRYRVNSFVTIASNSSWRGMPGATVFIDPVGFKFSSATIGGGTCTIYSSVASNVRIQGLTFQSSKAAANVRGLVFDQITGFKFEDNQVLNFGDGSHYAQGCVVFNSTDILVTGSRFSNCSGDGLALSNSCAQFRLANNYADTNHDYGIVTTVSCVDGTIEGNVVLNNITTGIGVDRCNGVSIVGNRVGGTGSGINVLYFSTPGTTNKNAVVTGNIVTSCSAVGIGIGSLLPAGDGLYVVNGNTVRDCNTGIRVVDAEYGSITGNMVYNTTNEAILLNGATTITGKATVSGNTINTCTYGIRHVSTGGGVSPVVSIGNKIMNASVAPTGLAAGDDYFESDVSVNYWDITKPINFPTNVGFATATGGAATLPANPVGFLKFYLNGGIVKVPYYNA